MNVMEMTGDELKEELRKHPYGPLVFLGSILLWMLAGLFLGWWLVNLL